MNDLQISGVERAALAVLTPGRRPQRPSAIVWDESFDVEGALGPIACWSSGAGPTALLVHGWESTHTDLDAFVAPFLASGKRVVTFDLPAHGLSAGTTASIVDLADAVRRVASRIGSIDVVVAHSIGCAATVVALEGGLDAGRVVLISPPERFSFAVAMAADYLKVDPLEVEAALFARGLDVPKLDLPKSAVAFTTPALVIHSADDRVVSLDGARRAVAAWRGSRLMEVDGLGHNRILGDASVVAATVEFASEG